MVSKPTDDRRGSLLNTCTCHRYTNLLFLKLTYQCSQVPVKKRWPKHILRFCTKALIKSSVKSLNRTQIKVKVKLSLSTPLRHKDIQSNRLGEGVSTISQVSEFKLIGLLHIVIDERSVLYIHVTVHRNRFIFK